MNGAPQSDGTEPAPDLVPVVSSVEMVVGLAGIWSQLGAKGREHVLFAFALFAGLVIAAIITIAAVVTALGA